ncbi:hypothetical protein FNT36_01990 [Hymenobacter setariae]|uniref:ABC transporter permease n=1 Tax=Hymenobacter setariae TaxID=2594794 RepID=A0A558C2D3_9BACT|nr:hypothetical protein [Hymenobacter setariae]TVT42886.1 hypothetical protein FNT36_01990 [Hymenobacter setariae]
MRSADVWASPIGAYLRLRLRLTGRLLREVGAVRLTLLLPFLFMSVGQALAVATVHPRGRWAVPVVVAWLLLSVHRQRSDYRFLATTAPSFRTWLAWEYALLALPVAVVLVAGRAYGPAALLLALAPLVAWAPPSGEDRASRRRWRSPFRSEAFEWVSGMRATKGLWLWPVLVGLAGWQRASPLAPLAALLVWLLVLACYGTAEPVSMLALAARSPKQFLRRRLRLGLSYAAASAAPFWALLVSGPAGWGGALAVAVSWLALVALFVVAKYAFYPNETHFRTTQGLVLSIVLLLLGHPLYPVLLLVAAVGLPWQSRRRLQQFIGYK